MTPGSCTRGHFAMGMFQDGCEAPSALSLDLNRIDQVPLLFEVYFKEHTPILIAESVLPLVTSQENHVLIYLANQLCVASRPASSVQRPRRVQRCNKQQGKIANT